MQVAMQPSVLYQLFLSLPDGAKPAKDDFRHVGTLDFYNAASSGDGVASVTEPSLFGSYDITDVVKKLRAQKLLSDRITITIIPSGAPDPNAEPKIGRIELVVQ